MAPHTLVTSVSYTCLCYLCRCLTVKVWPVHNEGVAVMGDKNLRPFAHAFCLTRCSQWEGHSVRPSPERSCKRPFCWALAPLLPLQQPSGRVSVARQKSPAPRKDNRIGTTHRSVPASVEGLAQACLIGDRPQSRHPDESTRPAHLVCGVAEEHPRWRMNLKQGHPGKLCQGGLDKPQTA